MKNNFLKYFIYFFIYILSIHRINSDAIKVSQTILDQATYFDSKDSDIYQSFIDFSKLKLYKIDMSKIYYSATNIPKFEFFFKGEELNIRCKKDNSRIKCADILLNEHECISFDYDYYLALIGGIFSFSLVLIGITSMLKGYIYFYLISSFYSSFSFILFCREFCELLELIGKLNTENESSHQMLIGVFVISIISCFIYGYASFLSKYLRYISFGFIDGLLFSKILFYFVVKSLETYITLKYFLAELISCIIFIAFWIFIQNKYPRIIMANISIMASYGILYGFNILIGGLPFLPFIVLAKSYKTEEPQENLFDRLMDKNYWSHYLAFFLFFICLGIYFNIKNYDVHMKKARKKISIY